MATDDIYEVKFSIETPEKPGAFTLFYQETVDFDASITGSRGLAEGIRDAINVPLRELLSVQCRFAGIRVSKKAIGQEAPFVLSASTGPGTEVGLRPGDPMPNVFAAQVNIEQTKFSARSNGRIFINGIPEDQANAGIFNATFQTTRMKPFVDALIAPVNEPSGNGVWNVGMISKKVLDLGPLDWEGAFAFAQNLVGVNQVSTQKVRGTTAFGAASL